ncbi:MAG: YbjN domain-containing protein [Micrococcales bacterium]|nr:YbjN domain-containing protein [Micrococcales bacterium]
MSTSIASTGHTSLPGTEAILPSTSSTLWFIGGSVVLIGLSVLVGAVIGARQRRPGGRAGAARTQRPAPVDRDRVAACLTLRGYHFDVDPDGDLTGLWDSHRFWFMLMGDEREIVQVRGRWVRTLAPEHRRAVQLAINDWNRDRIWPKTYLREEDGRLAVYAEVSADLEPGATDAQLDQILACGLGTGVTLFRELDAQIPADGTATA